MSTFDSTKLRLDDDLLKPIVEGKIQLPDFQRGWVWDDEHIRSLLVSLARSFPIGAVMLLQTGGAAKFQTRPVEGVELPSDTAADKLILDGQQRLTSLTRVLKLKSPVLTRDEKKRDILRYYYFDVATALEGPQSLEASIIAVDVNKQLRENFGRDVKLDLSTPELEYAALHFPCNQVLNADAWEEGLNATRPDLFATYMKFRTAVLKPIREYLVPAITLTKETSKEAVCLVFEKVNTGGVTLSVFELITATFAAEGFNLREDWYGGPKGKGRRAMLAAKPLLKEVQSTDFLQGISLLHSYEKRQADLKAGKVGKAAAAVSAKKEIVLDLPLAAFEQWSDPLTRGFLEAEKFLRHQGFHSPRFLPYRAQLVPLAALLALLHERWLEPQIQHKLSRWYWCGVFGELYGSASETRIANDLVDVLEWIQSDAAHEPHTVVDAGFQPSRLDTLRSRTSAAYRGLYVLLQREGARDFFWKQRMVDIDRDERAIDIHHIFPKKWCLDRQIPPRIFNSIINKTAISYKANRKIGGHAPSSYLKQIQQDKAVQIGDPQMDELLSSHFISPDHLRADDFESFMNLRRNALLALVEAAMGKTAIHVSEAPPEDEEDDETPTDEEENGTI